MSMFPNPETHAANPPASWQIVKAGRRWHLTTADSATTIGSYDTRKAAEADRTSGLWVRTYERESRWYAGDTPPGWRSYAAVCAERERDAAKRAARVAQYAARFRAETVGQEPPRHVEPTDDALREAFAACSRPPAADLYDDIRAGLGRQADDDAERARADMVESAARLADWAIDHHQALPDQAPFAALAARLDTPESARAANRIRDAVARLHMRPRADWDAPAPVPAGPLGEIWDAPLRVWQHNGTTTHVTAVSACRTFMDVHGGPPSYEVPRFVFGVQVIARADTPGQPHGYAAFWRTDGSSGRWRQVTADLSEADMVAWSGRPDPYDQQHGVMTDMAAWLDQVAADIDDDPHAETRAAVEAASAAVDQARADLRAAYASCDTARIDQATAARDGATARLREVLTGCGLMPTPAAPEPAPFVSDWAVTLGGAR